MSIFRKILISLFLICIGFILTNYFSKLREPYSIHVSSYTRQDGTHVSSYNRRPPGTASHDDLIKTYQFISTLPILVGSVYGFISIKNSKRGKKKSSLKTIPNSYPNRLHNRPSIPNTVSIDKPIHTLCEKKEIASVYRSQLLNQIDEAIKCKKTIRFYYVKEKSLPEIREIIPKQITNILPNSQNPSRHYYIIGFDLTKNDDRTFREDRILRIEII